LAIAFALLSHSPRALADDWTPTRSFRTFSKATFRGLPQSSVMALAQDGDGVLWIGTLDGVATFDGRSITPVADVAGAPLRGIIACIVARSKGGVYVGSAAGVHTFDGRAWHLASTSRGVASLAEAHDGTLWMTDSSGAVWTLREPDAWQRRSDVSASAVAIACAPDGAMWIATDRSAARIANGRVEAVGGDPLPGRPGALLAATDGRIWIATQAGTVHWTRGGSDCWHQVAFAPWPRNAFRCLAEDRRGRIWAGSFGGGVAFGTATTPWNVWHAQNGPFEGGVMSVLADREGSIWFGLNALGLTQWIGESWSHRTGAETPNPGNQLFSAFGISRGAAPHTLLVGAFNRGFLLLSNTGVKEYGLKDGITEDTRAAVEPEPGQFFVATRFGIFESKAGQPFHQSLKLPGGFVMGFFRSPEGLWYATSTTQGVFVRDGDEWKPATEINAALDNMHVRGMTWLRNGELWVATLRGITIFNKNAPPIRLTSARERALPESVNAVLQRSDDEVWTGGTGGIAVRHSNNWTRMTSADGIPGATVYSLALAPNGAVWAGGSAGVGRFLNGSWTTWSSLDGLLQEECNLNGLAIDDDGSIYAGTMGGLAHFDPNVTPLSRPPLKLSWRSTPAVDASNIAHLPATERSLHLRWLAAWLGPQPVQFRVRVPRLREKWSAPMSDDHLDVENLTAGDWRVEVQARVEGSHDWSAPLALNVVVAPFWYETIPARAAMIALLIGLIYLAVRLRLRALRHHAAMLEVTVHQRTAELAEKVDQLHESEQRALAASHAKSAFLANMSHELRTPLNGVLGFAQLLARRKNRDAEDREGLAVIMKSGEHLLNLINDVLSLSKIEAGRVNLSETVFDLRGLVRDVEDVMRFPAEEKNLHLVCEVDERQIPRAVRGDEGRLRQILINLVGNAVKFTERGSVIVRVLWKEGRAQIDVIDTGPGIKADELPRLFAPFVQTETGRRSKEGTGLGLALSRDLARLMQGDITVMSSPGSGSAFRIEVALPEAAFELLAQTRDRRRVVALAPGQGMHRILVVDDMAVNRTVLSRLLSSVGFDVHDVPSGEEALAIWRTWEPHLIWMDKRMSGMDGLEVTRTIRKEEMVSGKKRTPIIALSASALEAERGEILAAGCDDFVAKPFRETTIFFKLREHLGVDYIYESPAPIADRATPRVDVATPANAASVLLVDDDWICREVAQELLRAHGVSVTPASSGREALSLLAKRKFDLVLMDVQMPGMDGRETTLRIKEKHHVPIVAMTASSMEDQLGGMDDFIAKPVEPAALSAVLDRWLPRQRF
jgi:signal transduction histidine kinase/DNA-binding response OmpR family regulator/ligand-binding sensor domain-containing protein